MTFRGTLRPFQQIAADKMLDRGTFLLAHDLGLGKTVTSIAVAEQLIDTGEAECVLVVCLASIKWQWKRQIDNFSDGALILVVEGTKPQRIAQYRAVKRGEAEYVIMNYDQIVNDWDFVRHLVFDAVFLDEIAAIKTPATLRTRHLRRVEAPYKFGLTGKPIENRPEDLFHIMRWVDPQVFGDAAAFDRRHIVRDLSGKPIRYKGLRSMRETMAPAIDRKTHKDPDVRAQMPAVVVKDMIVEFDRASLKLYRHIVNELLDIIETVPHFSSFNLMNHYAGVEDNTAQGQIMARLVAMRMLCDHPDLLRRSARLFKDPKSKLGSSYAAELADKGLLDPLKSAPKLDTTIDLIKEILENDPQAKVVLFSFFKPMLQIIAKRLGKYGFVMFTGDLTPKARDAAIEQFQQNPLTRVFLSSDAGGVGVDLPQANYLMCVEPNTPILTNDLKWVPAGSLQVGDGLMTCEEYPRSGKGNSRRWQSGTVISNRITPMECVEVKLSNGESLTVSLQHPLLVQTLKGDSRWVEARNLHTGWKLHKYTEMWEPAKTFDAGWLSGLLDGEGCVSRIGHGLAVSLTQNRGPVLDRALAVAKEFGFDLRDSGRAGRCSQYLVGGGKAECMRFLGIFQPERLIANWSKVVGNHQLRAVESPTVVSVISVGVQDVSVLGTSTRTFIGAGYAQHNSYDLPWSAGKFAQRNGRIMRLSSKWPEITLLTMLMRSSIEERQLEMLMSKEAVSDAWLDNRGLDSRGDFTLTLGSLVDFLYENA